jgi:2Fe-2S ferredoxin
MKVRFLPQDVEFEIKPDQSVMKLAHEMGVKIKSVCNGMPSCAECRIKIVEGEQNVLPPSVKELSLIGTGYFIDQRRLSCQLMCFGDVTVDLSEQMDKVINDQQRRPQGSLKKDDAEVSRAVTGNLIDQDVQLLDKIDESTKVSQNKNTNHKPKKFKQRFQRK